MVNKGLKELSSSQAVSAIETATAEYFFALAKPLWKWHRGGEYMTFISGLPSPALNAVIQLRPLPGESDERIKEILKPFKAEGLPMTWMLGPSTRSQDTCRHLESGGLTYSGYLTGMAVGLEPFYNGFAMPEGLVIEPVTRAKMLVDYLRIYKKNFKFNEIVCNALFKTHRSLFSDRKAPIHYYIGTLNGKSVATSSLFLYSDIAGINDISVLPDFRRQGIGKAMILRLLREARERDCSIGILLASHEGASLYKEIGFSEFCKFDFYGLKQSEKKENKSTYLLKYVRKLLRFLGGKSY